MSDNKDAFLTVPNMKVCFGIFNTYMRDRYSFDVQTDGSKTNLKKLMYDIMKDIHNEYAESPRTSLKDMNNMTLNIARDYYTKNYGLSAEGKGPAGQSRQSRQSRQAPAQSKPRVQVLERDQQAYGQRILNSEQIKPVSTVTRDTSFSQGMPGMPGEGRSRDRQPVPDIDDVSVAFERIDLSRKEENNVQMAPPPEIKPQLETAYDPEEFNRMLSDLEKKRDDVEVRDLTALNDSRVMQDAMIVQTNAVQQPNPKDMYALSQSQLKTAEKRREEYVEEAQKISRFDLIAPEAKQHILLDKYLSISSFDRRWADEPLRFRFRVDFNFNDNSIQNRHKNIKSIQVTRAIIPMEIEEHASLLQCQPKINYNYEFALSYPYLLLQIDEFNDVYDGTNTAARNSFCHLVYDKCYKAKNGRGYIILNTMQKESKVFHPTPYPSLSQMTLSLRKPNGELLNTSKDDYKILKVEYDLYNKQYLKVVTHKYFDKNEFYRGDTVLMQNFELTNSAPSMTDEGVRNLNDFINRKEGHEIAEIGQPNDNGFYTNFYILGPGEFDTANGAYVLDSAQVSNLNAYNKSIDYTVWTPPNGNILNTSLQCSFAFSLQEVSSDPGSVDTSYFGASTSVLRS
jgi:hypothetical protein